MEEVPGGMLRQSVTVRSCLAEQVPPGEEWVTEEAAGEEEQGTDRPWWRLLARSTRAEPGQAEDEEAAAAAG